MSAATIDQSAGYAGWRRRLAGDLHGRVLEIGAADAANTAYLPRDVTWVGVEPDRRRAAAARANAGTSLRHAEVLVTRAEALPLPDRSVDAVLCTFALCSVRDQAAVLAEVRRVLEPGGTLRFLEHVGSPPGTWTRRLERLVRPFSVLFDHGCDPTRDTAAAIERAGFDRVQLERFTVPGPLGTQVEHIAGEARVA